MVGCHPGVGVGVRVGKGVNVGTGVGVTRRWGTKATARLSPRLMTTIRLMIQKMTRVRRDLERRTVPPDAGAVIISLPAERLPQATLSIQGLRPRDPLPAAASEGVRKIEDFGAVYGRADDSGTFRMVFPEEGRYRVLLISRQTKRDADTDIDDLDLSEITRYFDRAADLVGPSKYRWTLEEITADSPPIEHNFGRSAKE